MIKYFDTYIKENINELKSLIDDIIDSNIKRSATYNLIIKKDDEK